MPLVKDLGDQIICVHWSHHLLLNSGLFAVECKCRLRPSDCVRELESLDFIWLIFCFPKKIWVLEAWLPWYSYKLHLENLFGGSSKGAQLLVYPWPKNSPPLLGKVVLFNVAHSFGRDTHGVMREEGDTRLASQISRINPGDQWGDRCRSQIALTSYMFLLKY